MSALLVAEVAVAILFGLLVGSFLNVCIHRLPRGESVVHPRSSCPRCRGMLHWHDNVPLLSYLWLGGRCRRCALPISPVYPAVEAANGALYGLLVLRHGLDPAVLLLAAFASSMLVLILIDARHHILPNAVTLPGLALGFAGSFAAAGITPLESALGAALGWTVPWTIGAGYRLVRGREGMGMGDLKMLAMVGAFLGWKGVLFTIGAGSLVGAVTGVPWALARGQGMQAALPFGTFLGVAALGDVFGARQLVLGWLGIAG